MLNEKSNLNFKLTKSLFAKITFFIQQNLFPNFRVHRSRIGQLKFTSSTSSLDYFFQHNCSYPVCVNLRTYIRTDFYAFVVRSLETLHHTARINYDCKTKILLMFITVLRIRSEIAWIMIQIQKNLKNDRINI